MYMRAYWFIELIPQHQHQLHLHSSKLADLKCVVGTNNAFASFIFFSQPEISDHVAVHKINRSLILTGATKGRPLCVLHCVTMPINYSRISHWICTSRVTKARTHTAVKWFQISQLIKAALLFHADVSSHNNETARGRGSGGTWRQNAS
jgi:hypothetical protein